MPNSRSVLLIMDFQHSILRSASSPAVVKYADKAVRAARTNGIPVMFVRSPRHNSLVMEPIGDEPVITKSGISAFSSSNLDTLLRAAAADTLVLAGIATQAVVLDTLEDASGLGYRLIVLSDACADIDSRTHRYYMEKVFPRKALVIDTDEWIKTLGSSQGTTDGTR